jgi:hypothetical protein
VGVGAVAHAVLVVPRGRREGTNRLIKRMKRVAWGSETGIVPAAEDRCTANGEHATVSDDPDGARLILKSRFTGCYREQERLLMALRWLRAGQEEARGESRRYHVGHARWFGVDLP